MNRTILMLGLALVLVSLLVSPVSGSPVAYFAILSGNEEVPPVMTEATGRASFTLSEDGTTLRYVLTVTNLTDVFASHIHLATVGVNGPVVAGLFGGSMPGTFTGILAEGTITSADLTGPLVGMDLSALIAQIDAGNTYVNVHTLAHRPGEIRGQIMPIP